MLKNQSKFSHKVRETDNMAKSNLEEFLTKNVKKSIKENKKDSEQKSEITVKNIEQSTKLEKFKKEIIDENTFGSAKNDCKKSGIQSENGKLLGKTNNHIILAPENLSPSYLIDVKYDGKLAKAYLKLYNPEDGQVYRYYDKTNHLPYLYTTQTRNEVEQKLKNQKDFLGCETIQKTDLLNDKEITLTKVIATNPLAIGGGRGESFREQIKPSFEANIRYHLNYIYDNTLVPGLLYKIKAGKLEQVDPEISDNSITAIKSIFKKQSKEVDILLEQYLPIFFSPIPDIKRCSIDIEVQGTKGRFPDPNEAKEPIISIGFADTEGNVSVYVLNEKKQPINKDAFTITILEFTSEKELLEATFDKMALYPMMITFNGDNFDFPYLDRRAKRLGIEEEKIPFIRTSSVGNDTYLEHGLHLDLYRFFRQPSMRIYAFGGKYDRVTLDELGSSLLGKHKLAHEKEIWELSLEELIQYNVRDAEITLELTTFNRNQAVEIIFMLSRIVKMPIDDFTRASVSVWIQNWLYYEHRRRNYLIPRKQDILYLKGDTSTEATIKGKKYQGAIVIEPRVGVWWNVHVLDYASLYPSIIKTRNLSYETIRCKHETCRINNKIPETNHWVCTERVGIISMLIGFIRDVRVYWFKDKAKDESLSEDDRNINDVIQSALKVLINASYGVLGSENFAMYCPPVAESTTALAREAISKIKEHCEVDLGISVLYGDTDSIFIHKPKPEDIKELEIWSLDTFHIELGTDYVFRYCGLSSRKKNYFGITTKGYPIVKGLMGKKKNTPELVKKAFESVLKILTKVGNPEELENAKDRIIKITQNTLNSIEKRTFKLEDVAISVTLSKKLKEYDSWTQPLQAAIQLIIAKKGENPSVGSSITFVKTKPFKIVVPKNILSDKISKSGECSVKPIELTEKTDVDGSKMKEIIKSTFVQLLDTIGIPWNEVQGIKALDKWFK